jgi:hypothetical protein
MHLFFFISQLLFVNLSQGYPVSKAGVCIGEGVVVAVDADVDTASETFFNEFVSSPQCNIERVSDITCIVMDGFAFLCHIS